MENYRQLASNFLTNTFVENYEAYKEYVDQLNDNLKKTSNPYNYTYDEFCIELLHRFMNCIDRFCRPEEPLEDIFDKFEDLLTHTVKEIGYNISSSRHSSFA